MLYRLKYKTQLYKTPRRKLREKLLDIGLGNDFFVCDIRNKCKNKLLGLD